jgi:hypothetical protein
MSRLLSLIPLDLAAVRRITGKATRADVYEELLPEALSVLGDKEANREKAVAFWLCLGRSLDVLSSLDAYGSMTTFNYNAANSNKPGGKCSSKPRPRGAPRRRKPKLSVVE